MKKVDIFSFVFCVSVLVSCSLAARRWRGKHATNFHHGRNRPRDAAMTRVANLILKNSDNRSLDKMDNDCGETLGGQSGTLSHTAYSDNEACTWTIRVEVGKVIRLSFDSFDVESCQFCDCDRLLIYEFSSPDPVLTLCGSDIPADYTSASSALIIDFKSDGSYTGYGFEIHWQAEDNPVVPEPDPEASSGYGQISSPGFEDGKNYENNLEREWNFQNLEGATSLTLEFYSFELEACTDCMCDWLKIYEGDSTSPSYKLCGKSYPRILVLPGTRIRIQFHTDRTLTRRGFLIYWNWNYRQATLQVDMVYSEIPLCGDELESAGTFSSPGYEDDSYYAASTYCTWIIQSQSPRIQLTFENIDLDGCTSYRCSCDKIKIYDPDLVSFDQPSLELCEDWSEEVVITSSGDYLKVVLEADEVGGSRGFLASWKPFESVPQQPADWIQCGFESTTDYGLVASPWYPNPYPNNLNCTWTIRASGLINLIFEGFSLQRCGPDCLCDSLEIVRPGTTPVRLCGDANLGLMEELGSEITLKFVTDGSGTSTGFMVRWSTRHDDEPETQPGLAPPSCSAYNGSCGVPSIFPRQFPVSRTPAIPYSWPWHVSIQLVESTNHLCSGTIVTPKYVLTAAHCVFDKQPGDVKVSAGEYDLRNPTGQRVGYDVERILSHRDFVPANWKNDIAILELTTEMVFGITARPVCLSDMPVPEDLVCTYTGFDGGKLENLLSDIQLVILNEEESCSGAEDPVIATSPLDWNPLFIDAGAPLVCKHGDVWRQYGVFSKTTGCRGSDVSIFTAIDQYVEWIHATLQGLELPVSESDECSGVDRPVLLGKPSGSIAAPGLFLYGHYINNARCAWRILAPENTAIRLSFEFVDIEQSSPCSYDVLTIFDGYDMDSPTVLTICESGPQEDFVSTQNVVYVAFTSDETIEGRGFIIHYEAADGDHQQPPEPGHCGRQEIKPDFSRVVGGKEAKPHSWPWQASLRATHNHFCGGTLVSSRWIITAAHCTDGFRPDQLTVVLGEHNFEEETGTEQSVGVNRIIPYSNPESNDIALVELDERVEFSSTVSPACISDDRAVQDMMCVATGWGSTGMEYPAALRQVRVPIISSRFCNESYPGQIQSSMICAGYPEGGKDTCQGDSGGPLVCKAAGSYFLVGVTSWGRGCAEAGHPGVYVNVPHFARWITEQTDGEVLPTY